MTDELIAYSIAKMKEYGIVDSGDAIKGGVGAMTDARMKISSTRWWRPA